jgi:uncharacterized small protein (DUF1192 family)
MNLEEQYDSNIREVENQLRVTKAIIGAQVTNAELMVAIKQKMNAEQDLLIIPQMETDIARYSEALGDTDGAYRSELEGLEVTKVQLNSDVAALTEEIDRLKAEQTVSNATAITIEAQIASEEAQIRLEIAQAKLDGYNVQDTEFKNQINDLKIFAAMGDENA